jgi:2-polyprenyl-3-methyl-5-hydroxy-6-metoxy-1,4-benzoquinol methylase
MLGRRWTSYLAVVFLGVILSISSSLPVTDVEEDAQPLVIVLVFRDELGEGGMSEITTASTQFSDDHRGRIYQEYVSQKRYTYVPASVDDFLKHSAYYANLIKRRFPREKNVDIIELGCGFGMLIHFVRAAGYKRIEGVDISGEQILAARSLGLDCVREAEICQTLEGCASNSYDVVLMFDVLEHFRHSELLGIADSVKRVLRPGGRLICRVPNAEAPFAARMRYGDLTHQLIFTNDSFVQLFCRAGFKQVDCFDDVPVIHNLRSLVRATLWFAMRAWLRFWLSVETGGYARRSLFSQNLIAVVIK